MTHWIGFVVHGYGRADVSWDAEDGSAQWESGWVWNAKDEVFLALHQDFGVFESLKFHPRVRILGRDRLVAKVEADAVCTGVADHAAEEERGGEEGEVGVFFAVTEVPKNGGSRGTHAVCVGSVNSEGRATASDEGWDGKSVRFEVRPKLEHLHEGAVASLGTGGKVRVVDVSVVGVEAEDVDGG
jgi:hypothetical protein